MQVRFLKSLNPKKDWFTVGKEYQVIEKDGDGSFLVLDDDGDLSLLLPNEVEVIEEKTIKK